MTGIKLAGETMPFKAPMCKSSKGKNQNYISMHKPLDLLLLLGHHDFYEMDSGYKETLTTLYFIVHTTGIYQPFKTHQIISH